MWPPWCPLRPRWLAAGLVVGFAACVALGWTASAHSPYRNFVRLHQILSPEALYYPTVSQLVALVRTSVPEGKVAVIVGGSSVLNGVGQPAEQIWTRHLQERLGEPYRVVNLALRAGWHTEGGALVAEHLVKTGVPVILVADVFAGGWVPLWRRYEHMFWDAHYKGFLLDDPGRAARVRLVRADLTTADRERHDDRRLGARLDAFLRFNDLWNYLAYDRFMTVWSSLALPTPFRARHRYADVEADYASPEVQSMLRRRGEDLVPRMRGLLALTTPDGNGDVVADPALPAWRKAEEIVGSSMPPTVRQHALLLMIDFGARELALLSPAERRAYDIVRQRTLAIYAAAGYTVLGASTPVGGEHVDGRHLSTSGGVKLADEAAPAIRELARRLGYVP